MPLADRSELDDVSRAAGVVLLLRFAFFVNFVGRSARACLAYKKALADAESWAIVTANRLPFQPALMCSLGLRDDGFDWSDRS